MASKKKKENPYGENSVQVMGKPRAFANEDEYRAKYEAYIKHCYEAKMMPTKAGFSAFANLTRETYYRQRDYYPDTFHAVDLSLEDFAANQHAFTQTPSLPNALQYSRYAFSWDKAADAVSGNIMVDFDAGEAEIDNIMAKLGYLPKPEE